MIRIRMKLALALVFGSIFLQHAWALQDNQEEAARYAEAGQKAMASGQYAEARQNFSNWQNSSPT